MFLGLYTRAQTMWFGLRERMSNERGAVATEYALLITLVAIAIIAALTALGFAIAHRFSQVSKSLK